MPANFDAQPYRPSTSEIGAAGVQAAATEMLKRGIVPSYQALDIGYDVISDCNGLLKRVQVKTQLTVEKGRERFSSLRFSLLRRRARGLAAGKHPSARKHKHYSQKELDAMVFVNFERNKFFVVPVSEIDLSRYYITFPADSKWEDAWWVLGADKIALAEKIKAYTLNDVPRVKHSKTGEI